MSSDIEITGGTAPRASSLFPTASTSRAVVIPDSSDPVDRCSAPPVASAYVPSATSSSPPPPDLPDLSQVSQSTKGKARETAESVPSTRPPSRNASNEEAPTLKRKTSSTCTSAASKRKSTDGSERSKKPRVGADGLTAAERKEKKAAEMAAKKMFKSDNKKVASRKSTLHEMVIAATPGAQSSRYFGPAINGLTEDIKLADDEAKGYHPGSLEIGSPAPDALNAIDRKLSLVTYRRETNKYLDSQTRQFRRYEDGQVHSTLDKHVIYLLHASELDKIVGTDGTDAMSQRVQDIKRAVGCPLVASEDPEWKFIVLVQGMAAYQRAEGKRDESGIAGRLCNYATLDEVLMDLTVVDRVLLIRSESRNETQRWLFEMSIDVAYRPYKLLDRAPMDFLGIDGTSKGKVAASGSDKKTLATTYVAMLSSMHMITDGQSESIAARYPTLRSLISAFEAQPDLRARERLLVGLPMKRNKDGAQTAREIGKDTSKRVYMQLFSRDPCQSMTAMKHRSNA